MNWIQTYLLDHIVNNNIILKNIVYTVGVLLVFYGVKRYTMRIVRKKEYDAAKEFTIRKAVKSLFNVLFIIALLIIWYDSKDNILSFIGVFTAGMAIAMRDIILNMIGALYILWAAPFKIGDRIEISGQIGDVIDVKLLQFSILEVGNRIAGEQSTGRIVNIPNLYIFNYPLANYEKGFRFIWNELVIPIDKDSNWELAKELIYKLLEEHTGEMIEEAKAQINEAGKHYLIYYNNLTPTIYTELKEHQILFNVRYLCEPRKVRVTEHILWEAILKMTKAYEEIKLG
ncbi:mechanosensitive ion channel family protein [Cellulosilyticum sp. I15G10I2]|uniref:mechanosensitive ion channel family protein n=1 Tax=Cellulosilyticum sp. I15G10I2 TaxID=1892843 RepID=UPI00085C88D4|nr:mechanosensitive ion channel domain-containing protein [Cellulosilyticum sp. I15G10I2]